MTDPSPGFVAEDPVARLRRHLPADMDPQTRERWEQMMATVMSRVSTRLYHLDGVAWAEAPLPRRWHRCSVQTYGNIGLDTVERCGCGAIRRRGRRSWSERNSRRRS